MRPSSNLIPAIQRMAESNACWWLFYTLGNVATPFFLISPEYQSYNLVLQIFYMLFAANSRIWFHFSRFSWQEASMIATGISYVAPKKDQDEVFNSLRCVDITNFNWATSPG